MRSALAETDDNAEPMRAGTLYHRLSWYANESGDWQAGVVALERAAELIPSIHQRGSVPASWQTSPTR